LDLFLEELKSKSLSKQKVEELQKNVLMLLSEEQVVKTLYTPTTNYLLDKKIKNFKYIKNIPNIVDRKSWLIESFVVFKKSIIWDNKGFFWFIKYLYELF